MFIDAPEECVQEGRTMLQGMTIEDPASPMRKKNRQDECLEIEEEQVIDAAYKNLIKEYEFECLYATCYLYKNMPLFLSSIDAIRLHVWWIFANKYPKLIKEVSAVVAVMCGTQPKNLNFFNRHCNLCSQRPMDTSRHILFECVALSQVRKLQLQNIQYVMPQAMKLQFVNMTHSEKLCFLVSGLKCSYIEEWAAIYTAIAKFVFFIYEKRKDILSSE